MNLREAILEEHSKAQTKKITDWIGADVKRLDALMNLFMNDEYRVVQRSAWMISEIAKMHPEMFEKYLPALVQKLEDKGAHNAVKRNILRIFDTIDLPEPLHGPIMHHCFETLENVNETLAARAFSIGILSRLTKIYPEISNEFKMILEDYLQHESAPSFKSRANKALKQMKP
ncbi:hypothetical protein F0919_04775 [Taibaiella lutea]|uniref:HEAT repeat domain-containing protein n=1 Tax=Taibaiella lutea TaxID=2608001 RepID=A0A5M6CP33_9BACT|nr:hypothetical protein [Taibaiella lutea]KAA5536988.1 hypothetical protein F0919_04775 [Taibaiella lutea]